MRDLKERFSLADQIDTQDRWEEARRRAAAPESSARGVDWPPTASRRLAAAVVAFAVFAIAAVFAWNLSHPNRQPGSRPQPGADVEKPPGREAKAFIPKDAELDGDLTRLPLVFPDGSRATLVYPSDLRLAELGIQPDASYLWSADPAARFPIVFLHDPAASISPYVDGAEPIAEVDTPRGRIEIWAMAPQWESNRGLAQGAWIRYPLGSWTLLAASKTVADAYSVADHLQVRQTHEGFPVVDVGGPLKLAEGFGEAGGAQLAFGDAAADPDAVSQLDALILLSPDGCRTTPDNEFSAGYGSKCLGEGNVFASIYGDREFVTAVQTGVSVEFSG
jgi:hypothetical protein